MKYADIIVPRGRSNTKAIDFVVTNLKIRVPIEDLNENFSEGRRSFKEEGDHSLRISQMPNGLQILEDGNTKPTKKDIFLKLSNGKRRKLTSLLDLLSSGESTKVDELLIIDSLLEMAN